MSTTDILPEPTRKRRRFQYRLRSLLVLPVLCALGGGWYLEHRKGKDARLVYERAEASYEQGQLAEIDVCQASLKLCRGEEQMFFTNPAQAWGRHLARVIRIRTRVAYAACRLGEMPEQRNALLSDIDRYAVEAAERVLNGGKPDNGPRPAPVSPAKPSETDEGAGIEEPK